MLGGEADKLGLGIGGARLLRKGSPSSQQPLGHLVNTLKQREKIVRASRAGRLRRRNLPGRRGLAGSLVPMASRLQRSGAALALTLSRNPDLKGSALKTRDNFESLVLARCFLPAVSAGMRSDCRVAS
jgi:hypothetical protein